MSKFLNDRGTHLAAMIAYFALLSFVPLLLLALSLVALGGQQSESSYLIEELRRAFPASCSSAATLPPSGISAIPNSPRPDSYPTRSQAARSGCTRRATSSCATPTARSCIADAATLR